MGLFEGYTLNEGIVVLRERHKRTILFSSRYIGTYTSLNLRYLVKGFRKLAESRLVFDYQNDCFWFVALLPQQAAYEPFCIECRSLAISKAALLLWRQNTALAVPQLGHMRNDGNAKGLVIDN